MARFPERPSLRDWKGGLYASNPLCCDLASINVTRHVIPAPEFACEERIKNFSSSCIYIYIYINNYHLSISNGDKLNCTKYTISAMKKISFSTLLLLFNEIKDISLEFKNRFSITTIQNLRCNKNTSVKYLPHGIKMND